MSWFRRRRRYYCRCRQGFSFPPELFSPSLCRGDFSSCSSIYIVPRASLVASLSPVLYSGSTYFFRDQSLCLSRTTFVAILPFSDICSSPSTVLFRTLLRFTCSATRPIVPSRSDPFQDLRSVQWLLQAVSLYRRKTRRESMYVRMVNIGQRGPTSKMFSLAI